MPLRWPEEEEQEEAMVDDSLETGFPFQSGKWVSVASAAKKTKKHYFCAITSMNEKHPTVKFAGRMKSISTFIWPQTDDISQRETENVSAFLPDPVEGRRGGMTFPVRISGHVF
jgi:hypothetical protein